MYNITIEQTEKYIQEMTNIFKGLNNRQIPETMPKDIHMWLDYSNHNYREAISYRDKYIKSVGYSILCKDWLRPLARWIGDRKCLEIMSGSGALSYGLREEGVKIRATDDFSWAHSFNQWLEVERLDCIDAVVKYGKEVQFIICSWPYMDDTSYKALLTMREVNPKCRLIYIGEGPGGCTADDNFFDNIIEDDIKGFYEAVSKYKRWDGVHDRLMLVK